MELRQFVIEGLGHISALVIDDAAGVAAVVDPRRDVDVYLDEARTRGLRISHVVETHLHNDYVSGARELTLATSAEHVHAAGAELQHAYRAVRGDETFDVGSLRFRVLETPGHTPEHLSYSVSDLSRADEPQLLFTGGSLLVGAVGRTDLLGAGHAEAYARQMHASLHERLLPHEDSVMVLPTHGGGSLCSKDIATTPWSTLGFERRHDPLLAIDEVEAFVRALLADQPAFPHYFARMRPTNQAGPAPLGGVPEPQPLGVDAVRSLLAGEGLVIDARSPEAYAAGHVPGSLSIPAGSSFGTWLGWVVPHDRPLVLLLDSAEDWDRQVRQALRIGHENVAGYLHGGLDAWRASGGDVEAGASISVAELRAQLEREPETLVIDVRQVSEFEAGHVPGARHLHAGDLPERLAELPRDRPIAAICASGYRSSVAAGLLRQAGFSDVSAVRGGLPEWRAAGYPVETGGVPSLASRR
ncbi:MAG: rhodanese-like domain-containing protein [Chloroflexota bacterium]|nr:rhodanese-like domain-containing protein [Chloroflexota bacterium]